MTVSRRDFVVGSAASLGALAWGGASLAAAKSPSDIRIAIIGVRGRGQEHFRGLKENVVALCDVDEQILSERATQWKTELGRSLDTYVDYRKLLERDDIDAVSIATPNHTHSLIGIAAAEAGKHVYVEKPVSHNIWEGRQLAAAASRYNVIMQCGTQSRSSSSLNEAAEFVRNGKLGKIQYALGTCYKPRQSIGKLSNPLTIPKHINYDLWCGPAEKQELMRPQLHYDWHWDYNTGNGDMGNQGIHQMDIARWFLGEDQMATRVLSIGGRLGYEDAANTPNTQIAYFEYPNAPLIFETRGLPRDKSEQTDWETWKEGMDRYRGSQIGVIVQCEQGYVLIPNTYNEVIAYDNDGSEVQRWQGGGNHYKNWLQAVEAGEPTKLNGKIHDGDVSSSMCHLGAISHQLGKVTPTAAIAEQIRGNTLLSASFDRMASHLRANDIEIDTDEGAISLGPWLDFDPQSLQFKGNDEANAMVSRDYRKPFTVPKIDLEA